MHTAVTPGAAIVDPAMAQAASRRSRTAEAVVRSQVSPCGICGGQSDSETGYCTSTWFMIVIPVLQSR